MTTTSPRPRVAFSDKLEIVEYAEYLGLDPVDDRDLLYIAKEGLKAPLPQNWKLCKSPEG